MHGILLTPMGDLAYVGRNRSPARDLYVALCGPLTLTLQACSQACGQWRAAQVHADLHMGDLVASRRAI